MTLFFEIDSTFHLRPKFFYGDRGFGHVVWLWFGIGWFGGDMSGFHERAASGTTTWKD